MVMDAKEEAEADLGGFQFRGPAWAADPARAARSEGLALAVDLFRGTINLDPDKIRDAAEIFSDFIRGEA